MTDKPVFRDCTIGFRVTSEMIEDFDFENLQRSINESRAASAAALADALYADIAEKPRFIPTVSLFTKLKRWIGFLLWRLATHLDPDLLP